MEAEVEGWLRRSWRSIAARLPGRIGQLSERIAERDLLREASSLGFYAFISALPMLTVTFRLVGAVAGESGLEQLASQAEDNGPAGAAQLLQQVRDSSDTLSWAAVLFTLWPATAYGGGLRRALERATGRDEPASGLRGRATAVGLVLVLPVLLLGGLPLTAVLTSLGDDGLAGTILGWSLALVAGAAGLTVVLALVYRAFSPTQLSWDDTLRGAAVTAVTTTVFSIGFVAYLQIGDVEDRFGGATVGMVVMLGIYLFVANVLLLAGFEVAIELDDGVDAPSTGPPRGEPAG